MDKLKNIVSGGHSKDTDNATSATGTEQRHPIYDEFTKPSTTGASTSATSAARDDPTHSTQAGLQDTAAHATGGTVPGSNTTSNTTATPVSNSTIKSGVLGFPSESHDSHAALGNSQAINSSLSGDHTTARLTTGSATEPSRLERDTSKLDTTALGSGTTGNTTGSSTLGSSHTPEQGLGSSHTTTQEPTTSSHPTKEAAVGSGLAAYQEKKHGHDTTHTSSTSTSKPETSTTTTTHQPQTSNTAATREPYGAGAISDQPLTSSTSSTTPLASSTTATTSQPFAGNTSTTQTPVTGTSSTSPLASGSTNSQPLTGSASTSQPLISGNTTTQSESSHLGKDAALGAGAIGAGGLTAHELEKKHDKPTTTNDRAFPLSGETSQHHAETSKATEEKPGLKDKVLGALGSSNSNEHTDKATTHHSTKTHEPVADTTSEQKPGLKDRIIGLFGSSGTVETNHEPTATNPNHGREALAGATTAATATSAAGHHEHEKGLTSQPHTTVSGTTAHPDALAGATAAASKYGGQSSTGKEHDHLGHGHDYIGDPCADGKGVASTSDSPAGLLYTKGPHKTDAANLFDPHVPGGFPTGAKEESTLASEPKAATSSHLGHDTALAGGAGATAGTAADAYKGHHEPTTVGHASVPSEASPYSSTKLDPRVHGSSGLSSSTQPTTASGVEDKHLGRDAGLAGIGGLGAGGLAAHELNKPSATSTQPATSSTLPTSGTSANTSTGPTSGFSSTDTTSTLPTSGTNMTHPTSSALPSSTTNTASSSLPATSATSTQPTSSLNDHHLGRDAALTGAGAATTTGLFANQRANAPSSGPASSTIGPHSSNVANVLDPRVQPDPTYQKHHHAAPTVEDPAPSTVGPHKSDIANIADPRVLPDPAKQKAVSKEDSHTGRDVAIGALGGAGAGAYATSHHDAQQPTGTQASSSLPTTHGTAGPTTSSYDTTNPATSANALQGHSRYDSVVDPKKDHTTRDTALAGTAGATAASTGVAHGDKHHEKEAAKLEKQHEKEAAKLEKQHEKEAEKAEKKHEKELAKEEKHEEGKKHGGLLGFLHLGKNKDEKHTEKHAENVEKTHTQPSHTKEHAGEGALASAAAGGVAAHEHDKHHTAGTTTQGERNVLRKDPPVGTATGTTDPTSPSLTRDQNLTDPSGSHHTGSAIASGTTAGGLAAHDSHQFNPSTTPTADTTSAGSTIPQEGTANPSSTTHHAGSTAATGAGAAAAGGLAAHEVNKHESNVDPRTQPQDQTNPHIQFADQAERTAGPTTASSESAGVGRSLDDSETKTRNKLHKDPPPGHPAREALEQEKSQKGGAVGEAAKFPGTHHGGPMPVYEGTPLDKIDQEHKVVMQPETGLVEKTHSAEGTHAAGSNNTQ